MSLAKPHCRNSMQRLRGKTVAVLTLGSRGRDPGVLRPLRPSCHSNPRWVHPMRLCECGPGTNTHVKSMGTYRSSPIPAKIAASLGWQHPISIDVSKVTPRTGIRLWSFSRQGACQNRAETSRYSRALAHVSLPQICIRAEARRGSFPPLALQAPGVAPFGSEAGPLALQHQTGPP